MQAGRLLRITEWRDRSARVASSPRKRGSILGPSKMTLDSRSVTKMSGNDDMRIRASRTFGMLNRISLTRVRSDQGWAALNHQLLKRLWFLYSRFLAARRRAVQPGRRVRLQPR